MSYVLITGASAGLGSEFARQLAAEGQDLILSARRLDRLEALADELREQFKVAVEVISADLAAVDGAANLAQALQDKGLSVHGLVNNAGFGDRGAFADLPLTRQLNMIQLNVTALTELTHRLLPSLKSQQGAFIINVASMAAFQAGPNMAVYYATKAFVLSFTEALTEELKPSGVTVSCLCPGATATEFAQEANMTDSLLFKAGAMQSDAVVRQSLRRRKQAIVVPGLTNNLTVNFTKAMPRAISRKIAGTLQR